MSRVAVPLDVAPADRSYRRRGAGRRSVGRWDVEYLERIDRGRRRLSRNGSSRPSTAQGTEAAIGSERLTGWLAHRTLGHPPQRSASRDLESYREGAGLCLEGHSFEDMLILDDGHRHEARPAGCAAGAMEAPRVWPAWPSSLCRADSRAMAALSRR